MRYTLQISTLSRYIFKNHSPRSFRTLLPTAIVSTSNELVQESANNNIRVIRPRTTSLVTWSMKRLQSNGEDDNLHQALPSTPGLPRHPYGNPMADFRLTPSRRPASLTYSSTQNTLVILVYGFSSSRPIPNNICFPANLTTR